jgi:hypothetical protein
LPSMAEMTKILALDANGSLQNSKEEDWWTYYFIFLFVCAERKPNSFLYYLTQMPQSGLFNAVSFPSLLEPAEPKFFLWDFYVNTIQLMPLTNFLALHYAS